MIIANTLTYYDDHKKFYSTVSLSLTLLTHKLDQYPEQAFSNCLHICEEDQKGEKGSFLYPNILD
jgi:hypothetical protein